MKPPENTLEGYQSALILSKRACLAVKNYWTTRRSIGHIIRSIKSWVDTSTNLP